MEENKNITAAEPSTSKLSKTLEKLQTEIQKVFQSINSPKCIHLRRNDFKIINNSTLDLGQGYSLNIIRDGRIVRVFASKKGCATKISVHTFIPTDPSIETIYAFLNDDFEWYRICAEIIFQLN